MGDRLFLWMGKAQERFVRCFLIAVPICVMQTGSGEAGGTRTLSFRAAGKRLGGGNLDRGRWERVKLNKSCSRYLWALRGEWGYHKVSTPGENREDFCYSFVSQPPARCANMAPGRDREGTLGCGLRGQLGCQGFKSELQDGLGCAGTAECAP